MPIIWWGTKVVTNHQGYAADFCPICRDITAMRIYREGIASHIYGIAYGGDHTLSHSARCEVCKSFMPTDFKRFTNIHDSPDPLRELIRRTNPRIYETNKERLELEQAVVHALDTAPRKARSDLRRRSFTPSKPRSPTGWRNSTSIANSSWRLSGIWASRCS